MSRIWLGKAGSESLLSAMGRRLTEEDIEIAREGRTASGRMVTDVITTKKKFTLSYSFVTGTILDALATIYSLGGVFTLLVEREDTSIDTYEVRFRPFSRARLLLAGTWYWEGIALELEEV